MPSDGGSLHNIRLDSLAAVNTVGFPFLDSFPSTWIVSFIENIYIYTFSFILLPPTFKAC